VSILKKLGHDTISRLVIAASSRYEEARYLSEGGYHLSAVYLAGYAAEMTIGAAYFRLVRKYGPNRELDQQDLQEILRSARILSKLEDKSHPIDGLANLLIRDKSLLNPPGIEETIGQKLLERVGIIALNWGPRLRYRAIQATTQEADRVLKAARWIIDHCPRH
jgi:HEPN domain-containing protein